MKHLFTVLLLVAAVSAIAPMPVLAGDDTVLPTPPPPPPPPPPDPALCSIHPACIPPLLPGTITIPQQ
jgi:hypothetical protein